MTCHYTNTHWRDALYNAVRACDGGVEAAAQFLTTRRDTSMHPESLRRKLRGGDQLDVDVALLLAEFVSKDVQASGRANDWLLSLCVHEGLHVDDVPAAPLEGWVCEAKALSEKLMAVVSSVGEMASATALSVADNRISQDEADRLVPLFRSARVMLHRMERNVTRAVSKGGAHG